jgi:hypothetical protein
VRKSLAFTALSTYDSLRRKLLSPRSRSPNSFERSLLLPLHLEVHLGLGFTFQQIYNPIYVTTFQCLTSEADQKTYGIKEQPQDRNMYTTGMKKCHRTLFICQIRQRQREQRNSARGSRATRTLQYRFAAHESDFRTSFIFPKNSPRSEAIMKG